MALNAVWLKINQLEKMTTSLNDQVASQAEEIDCLKTYLGRRHLAEIDKEVSENRRKSMGPSHPTNNNSINTNLINPVPNIRQPQNNVSTVNRNSSVPPAFPPYSMNPHVHPSSAIPPIPTPISNPKPVINLKRIVTIKNNNLNNNGTNNTNNNRGQQNVSLLYGGGGNSLNHGLNKFTTTPTMDSISPRLTKRPPTSTTLASNRHSIHGTRPDSSFNLEADEELANDDQDDQLRRSRQSFVEQSPPIEDEDLSDENVAKDDEGNQDEQKQGSTDRDDGCSNQNEMDQEHQVNCKRLKTKQPGDDDGNDSSKIKFVSYTEPDHFSSCDLAEYLMGKVIDKDLLPRDEKELNAYQPPHTTYTFRKIERNPAEKLTDNNDQSSNWPWEPTGQKPVLPENLQLILKNSPFR